MSGGGGGGGGAPNFVKRSIKSFIPTTTFISMLLMQALLSIHRLSFNAMKKYMCSSNANFLHTELHSITLQGIILKMYF